MLPHPVKCMATEVFGPGLTLRHVESIDEAIRLVNSGEYGNMACLFTSSGGIVFCAEANKPA